MIKSLMLVFVLSYARVSGRCTLHTVSLCHVSGSCCESSGAGVNGHVTLSEGTQPEVSNEGPIDNALCIDPLLNIVVIVNHCNWVN